MYTMNDILHGNRVLIYSHDSFGLGHLRRCQTIAHNLHYGLFNAPQGMAVSMMRRPNIGSGRPRRRETVRMIRAPIGICRSLNEEP